MGETVHEAGLAAESPEDGLEGQAEEHPFSQCLLEGGVLLYSLIVISLSTDPHHLAIVHGDVPSTL